jgi:EAL domain-containing protein (putative c-di-GMP-specific phosphodiesterase class I)
MEALVRWVHPELGLIQPKKFIEWAEDSGLIVPLGAWVLREACAQNRAWQEAGLPRLRVAVNLSANQFKDEEFVQTVEKTLAETNLAPDCLDLELTESVIMDNVGRSLRAPHDLKAMGIRFSIDDFGTGYSSLSYLKHFPVHTLKMDQSFVKDLSFDPNDTAIATAVIALGHSLNLSILAEGVETEQQLEVLRQLGCDKMQGYLFSEPLEAVQFEKLLRSKKHLNGDTLFETIALQNS